MGGRRILVGNSLSLIIKKKHGKVFSYSTDLPISSLLLRFSFIYIFFVKWINNKQTFKHLKLNNKLILKLKKYFFRSPGNQYIKFIQNLFYFCLFVSRNIWKLDKNHFHTWIIIINILVVYISIHNHYSKAAPLCQVLVF